MVRARWILLLKIVVTALLLGAVLTWVDLADVWRRVRMADPWRLLAAIALMMAGYALCGLRWAWIAEGLGIAVSAARKVRLYFLGMFASLFLPSTIGGDVVRGVLLARGEGRKGHGAAAAASVVLDRANGLYALVLLIAVFLPAFQWPAGFLPLWYAMVVALWLGWMLLPLIWPRLPARLRALPLVEPGFRRMWWRALPVSLAFQLCVIQAHVWLGGAVGLAMGWPAFAVMVGLSGLVAILPVSLNGFGLREAGYVGLAVWLGGDADAAAAMAALWIVVLAVSSLPGLWVIWRLGGRRALARGAP
ncbi:MAG: lysylphosphatidylglycerol synthase transmembrane domain-containing protein [Mariprofundaceae bacterium]